ncbi:MAG: TolC family protein [Desulfobacterales bacterium]|nr:MAG: TolC family protein [Desulfobacterales bacterium]
MKEFRIHWRWNSIGRPFKTIPWIVSALIAGHPGSGFHHAWAVQPETTANLEAKIEKAATVADLIAYAYRENPSIQAAREEWKATVEEYKAATALPDPQLLVSYFPEPIETRLGPQDWNLTLSQLIPYPGKLSKAGEVVQADAQIARLKLDRAVRDMILSIRESFQELVYIREAKTVVKQNLQLLDHLRKVAETSYAEGRAVLMDMIKAQSQSGQLRYDALLLEELEMTEKTRLNGILNRTPDAAVGTLEAEALLPVVFQLGELYRLAEANQEEIRIAGMEVEKADVKIDLARYQYFPDFRFGLFYAAIGDPDVPQDPPDAGRDAFGVQAGLTLPLWFGQNKARLDMARAAMKKAKAAETARINETRTRIRELFFRLENSRRLMDLYGKELLPQAARSMEIAETWFREGESTFSDFVETQAVWYNFQLALARARADYGKFLARLERLVGQSLTVKTSTSVEDAGKGVQ